MLEKAKLSFDIGSITIKANQGIQESKPENTPATFIIALMVIQELIIQIFDQCETHKQLKERQKPFGSTDLKLFTHQILMRKK